MKPNAGPEPHQRSMLPVRVASDKCHLKCS
uniref:Uncharacterized protein n=1 Tax=Tetranychus urticae TaxID=32264 RepID=T1KJ89_TETUR